MDKYLFQEIPISERPNVLRDNAHKVREGNYLRQLSEEEIADMKHDLYERMREINRLENELKEVKADYKEKLKPLQEDKLLLLDAINYGATQENGTLFEMHDFKTYTVYSYNPAGELISERPMEPGERQKSIFSEMPKTGTHE